MYATKKDVDKHVSDMFSKTKSEYERSLKGYAIARLYFEVKDLEMAKRHLASFLSVRDEHSAGHKMMGQIAETTGNFERALQCYKRSLDLDPNQKDLILKICDLYCQLTVDPETARYWADRAEKLFPRNKTVFKLRECIVNAEGEPNQNELENLISSELVARPRDVSLYVKLLKLYMDSERIELAFNYSLKVEEKQLFPNSTDWYYCLSDICEAYEEEIGPQLKLEFCVHYALVLDRLVSLLISEPHFFPPINTATETNSKHGRSVADAAAVLHTFDQFLLKTSQLNLAKEGPFKYIHHQMRGQLYLHLALLLLKRAKKDQGNWKEACRYSSALLLVAYTFKADNLYQEMWFGKIENKKPFLSAYQFGQLRLSYAGHMLNSLCKEEKCKFLQKIKNETCIQQVREKIFQRAFGMLSKPVSVRSFFLVDTAFIESSLEFPSAGSLQEYDKVAHKVYPDSLNHLVWLTLHRKMENKTKNSPRFQVFEKLQYSSNVLNNGAPETLCQLDSEAFLIASVVTTDNAMEKRKNLIHRGDETVLCLPPHIGDPLCTEEQSNWWRTAYSLYSNTSKEKIGEMRQVLRRGLEIIRGVGNHGLDVSLVVHLAKHFAEQAISMKKRLGDDVSEEVVSLEERAIHYWNLALNLFEKVALNRRLQQPKERLFGLGGKELSTREVENLREEGKFYLACHHMNNDALEQAAEEFSKLSLPYAAYNQSKVLKKLASQCADKTKKIALLAKAKESLYLTMDRIAGDRKHVLNLTLQEEIEALEMELTEKQRDSSSIYDEEDRTDDDEEPGTMNGSPRRNLNATNGLYEIYSTPRNSPVKNATNLSLTEPSMRHIRPSPERLDSQIRALGFTQENLIKTLVELRTSSAEQQQSVLETNKAILDELKAMKTNVEGLQANVEGLKGNVGDLKKQFEDFQKTKCQHCNRNRGPHLKSTTEEELEEEEDENGYDENLYDYSQVEVDNGYSYNAYNHGVLHGPHRGSSNMAAYNYQPPPQAAPPPMMLHYPQQYPPGTHVGQPPMGPLDMAQARPRNYYPHFPPPAPGLPFSEGQQLPQFSFRMPPPSPGILPSVSQPIAPPQTRPAFNRIPELAPMMGGQVMSASQQPFAPPAPPKKDLQPVAEPSTSWNNQSNSGSNPPHAFQIPLPPSVGPSGVSTQPPAILSTPTFVPPGFNASQLDNQSSQDSQLKTALSSTPNTSVFGSPGSLGLQSLSTKSPKKQDSSYEQVSGNESEEETGGYFKPLIPLPAEIDIHTGEENEKLLFEERAKLFRYVEKEWKERGVGNVKLLLNEASDRVRLVMRRDQVLKICANHYIKANMELREMKDNEKAWVWIAEDFADEEVKPEQFCIRFKSVDIAKAFKVAFDQAKKKDLEPIKVESAKSKATELATAKDLTKKDKSTEGGKDNGIKKAPVGFGEAFKPAAGSWSCDACYLTNVESALKCVACEKSKPGTSNTDTSLVKKSENGFKFGFTTPKPAVSSTITESKPTKSGFGDKFKPAVGSWTCDTCYVANTGEKLSCAACESPKPGTTKSDISNPTAIKFGVKATPVQSSKPNAFGGVDLSSTSSGFIKPTPQTPGSDQIAKPVEFKFGVPVTGVSKPTTTVAEASSTTALNSFTNTQTASQASTTKAVIGGFTFTMTPKVATEDAKKDEKPVASKDSSKTSEQKNVSPFAGFQFAPSKLATSQPTNLFGSLTTQPNKVPENPPTFGASSSSGTLAFASLPLTGDSSAFKSLSANQASPFLPTPESPKEVPEEFEPSVEFMPVVPLPELVEVKTGEENEEALFSERAKLFRFDPTTKEWKERGIGIAKILKNNETGKFRVLMRREQVLKLCANHYILSQMTLSAMNNSNKAWSWFAQDFSEGEVRTEHLAIRFKSKDLAINFHRVFEKCTKEANVETSENKLVIASGVSGKPETPSKPLSEIFKPKEGSWECETCYVRNEAGVGACVSCLTKNPNATSNEPTQTVKISVNLTKKSAEFECSACYMLHTEHVPNCKFCGCPRPPKSSEKKDNVPSEEDKVTSTQTPFKFGVPDSNNQVFGQKEYTFGSTKAATPLSNFVFGKTTENAENLSKESPQVKSIFGTTTNTSSGVFSSKPSSESETSIGFRFGSPQKFEFNFSGPRARSPSKAPKSPGTPNDSVNNGTEDEGDVSSDADNIFFQPVIPLPPKVDVKTGEEDEEAVYNQRAKLYRFDAGEWKERGTGDIKILYNEKDNKSRLLMRREQVLKVCLNHCLSKDIKLQKKNEKTWLWAASDFSDGEARLEKFAIRFKSQEIADQFEKAFEDYKNRMPAQQTTKVVAKPISSVVKSLDFSDKALNLSVTNLSEENTLTTPKVTPVSSTPQSSPSAFSFKLNPPKIGGFGLASRFGVDTSPPKTSGQSFVFGSSPSVSDSKFVISDISVVEEKQATAEQKERAEKLQLPTNFYLYEKKEPCKGCRGCDQCENEVEVVYERVPTEEQLSKAALLKLPPSFFFYDEKPPCPGCRGCTDGEEIIPIDKTSLPPKNLSPPKELSNEPTKTPESVPKEPEPEGQAFSSGAIGMNNIGLFSSTSMIPAPLNSTTQSDSLFGSLSTATEFSFAALANLKGEASTPIRSSGPHVFEGAGTPLFAAGRPFSARNSSTPGHDDEVAPSPDIHFEPVIPLPELIEVVTGEEEETVIFNERAKLYRYDKGTSQWKERGVGQFKILKHKSKCQYRLLLRREQVHKIACNHYITSKVELNSMVNNENSLCWTAMDFTEGTLISELFAIKFKNKDFLHQFKTKFNECHKDVCENGTSDVKTDLESSEGPEESPVIEEPAEAIVGSSNEADTTTEITREAEEEDDEYEIMFEKRVTLTECLNNTKDYKSIGMGTLQIRYDDSIFCARIQMTNDQQELLCDHYIALQTCLRVKDHEAFWSAVDMTVEPPKRRQFKAIFSSKNAVQEFERVFEEGKHMALESEIVERDDPVKI